MINLIGQTGPIQNILKLPYAHLHLYGKERPGRKIGHINITADSYKELVLASENLQSLIPDVLNSQTATRLSGKQENWIRCDAAEYHHRKKNSQLRSIFQLFLALKLSF